MSAYSKMSIKRYYSYNYNLLNNEANWCYSAEELKNYLCKKFKGEKISGIYIDAEEFMDSIHKLAHNHVDMAFGNGLVLAVIGNVVLKLGIHAEGMFSCHEFELESLELKEHFGQVNFDGNKSYLFDITDLFVDNDFVGHEITEIDVAGTDYYSFSLSGFSKAKADAAALKNDLPQKIIIKTDNNVCVELVGDSMEYFYINVSAVPQTEYNQ